MLEYRSFFIEVIPLPLKQRSSYYKNCIIFYYYKNRSIAEISKENSGEKYLFSLYPIPTHDYFLGLLIFCSLTCLFFFFLFLFTTFNYYSVVCTCIIVLLHLELESSSYNPTISLKV